MFHFSHNFFTHLICLHTASFLTVQLSLWQETSEAGKWFASFLSAHCRQLAVRKEKDACFLLLQFFIILCKISVRAHAIIQELFRKKRETQCIGPTNQIFDCERIYLFKCKQQSHLHSSHGLRYEIIYVIYIVATILGPIH